MKFLQKTIDSWAKKWSGQRLLLAYSGGADSSALLDLLLLAARRHRIALALLHVNHCWSSQSDAVARRAAETAAEHALPYHERRLPPPPGNRPPSELLARRARRCFFSEVATTFCYDAVVTAHHGNDQVETIFKRILEGSHLDTLSIKAISRLPGQVPLVRPLLSTAKEELLAWCHYRALSFWEDPSNQDPCYLRNKLRNELLPEISVQFGKQIHSPLLQLGEESQQLASYLSTTLTPLLKSASYADSKTIQLDLSSHDPQHPYLLHQLLRQLAQELAMHLSREQLQQATDALATPSHKKRQWKGLSGTLTIVHQKIHLQSNR